MIYWPISLSVRKIPLPPLVRAEITAPYRDLVYFVPVPSIGHLLPIRDKYPPHAQILLGKITSRSKYDGKLREEGISYEDFLYYRGYEELYGKDYTKDKILHSKWLLAHVLTIIKKEMDSMQDKIRAVVLFDYEKGHANISGKFGMGGAIGFFESLVTDERIDTLNPIFVTGKSLLVDDDVTNRFIEDAALWKIKYKKHFTLKITSPKHTKYSIINGKGRDWNTETYTRYVTHLFESGITKLLVGTRFLLGEGWDSQKLNVLFDMTLTTGYASVNQIKGRAFRRDPENQFKVSHIWEFVLSPAYGKYGMENYQNFSLRHQNYFGLDDKQNIRSGIQKFHPSLIMYPKTSSSSLVKEIEQKLIKIEYNRVNKAMLQRIDMRDTSFQLWKVGENIGQLTNTYTIPLTDEISSLDSNNYLLFEDILFATIHFIHEITDPTGELLALQREDNIIAIHFSNILDKEKVLFMYNTLNNIEFNSAFEIQMDIVKFGARRLFYEKSLNSPGTMQKIFSNLSKLFPPVFIKRLSFIIPLPSINGLFPEDINEYNNPVRYCKDNLFRVLSMKKSWLGKTHKLIYDHIGAINLETRFIDL